MFALLQLRMAGNVLAMNGDFAEAVAKYQEVGTLAALVVLLTTQPYI